MKPAAVLRIYGNAGQKSFIALEWTSPKSDYLLNTYDSAGALLHSGTLKRTRIMLSSISPDLQFIAHSDGASVRLFDTRRAALVSEVFEREVEFLGVNASGDMLIQGGSGQVQIVGRSENIHRSSDVIVAASDDFSLTLERGRMKLKIKRNGIVISEFEPEGFAILVAIWKGGSLFLSEAGGNLREIEIETGEILRRIECGPGFQFNNFAVTEEEIVTLAVNLKTCADSQLRHYHEGEEIRREMLDIAPNANAFIAAGKLFISGTRDIFDCATGKIGGRF